MNGELFDEEAAIESYCELTSKLNSHIYGTNKEFNEQFDEDFIQEFGVIVINGFKISPSEILFYLKKESYDDSLSNWKAIKDEELKNQFEELLEINSNFGRVQDLVELIKSKRVIPFIGAGLTVDCGMPTWSNFLMELGREQRMDVTDLKEKIESGLFDECADQLLQKMQEIQFNEKYRHKFTLNGKVQGPVTFLPLLFTNGVITTNFDKVLESAYGGTVRVVEGVNSDWINDLKKGKHQIYKIHGTMEGTANRVLTKNEYDARYGNSGIDFNLPLAKFLKTTTEVGSLFFIGCSLTVDRVIQVLAELKNDHGSITHHYALLQKPDDEEKLVERQDRLASVNILPIWYPEGEYEKVELLLRYIEMRIKGAV
ncbi:SIR2 family protein [Peredibacter sp. HCB2-198]|uniref:SIR2 family protein n=1 Tax=Peredibacter sp. HCB2-198 TaxID=3383025 RepID=UPI0038B60B2A